MMDAKIDNKIPTPEHVADSLNFNGWNKMEVVSIWTVSTNEFRGAEWSCSDIESLGGRGSLSRIWNRLKSNHQTGFPKRHAEYLEQAHPKKHKVSPIVTLEVADISSKIDVEKCPSPTLSMKNSSIHPRKKLRAGRKGPVDVRNKITWWLNKNATSSPISQPQPGPSTPISAPATPRTMSSKRCKRKPARKIKKKDELPFKRSPSMPDTPSALAKPKTRTRLFSLPSKDGSQPPTPATPKDGSPATRDPNPPTPASRRRMDDGYNK